MSKRANGSAGDDRINRVVEFIHKNYSEKIDVRRLASDVFMETNHFIKVFKKHIGLTPYQYIKDYRLAVASDMLKRGAKVKAAAQAAGYMSVSAFSNAYKKRLGIYPGTVYEIKKQAELEKYKKI